MAQQLKTPKVCPRCPQKNRETVATTDEELDALFGMRRVPDGGKKSGKVKIIPQSHCRKCRSEQSRERRQAQRQEKLAPEAKDE